MIKLANMENKCKFQVQSALCLLCVFATCLPPHHAARVFYSGVIVSSQRDTGRNKPRTPDVTTTEGSALFKKQITSLSIDLSAFIKLLLVNTRSHEYNLHVWRGGPCRAPVARQDVPSQIPAPPTVPLSATLQSTRCCFCPLQTSLVCRQVSAPVTSGCRHSTKGAVCEGDTHSLSSVIVCWDENRLSCCDEVLTVCDLAPCCPSTW